MVEYEREISIPEKTDRRRILVSRRRGGLGDVICCEVALRAVRERYPDAEIWYILSDPYFLLYADQGYIADKVFAPDPWEEVVPLFAAKCDLHLELDGPEMRHQLDTDYNITKSRIQSWCEYVDCMPKDMCPRWFSTPKERLRMCSWLDQSNIRPFSYALVQWSSAESKKDYTHMETMVRLLKGKGMPVVVVSLESVPDMDVCVAISWPNPRDICTLAQLAGIVIGPDSSMQHIAAAVKTPSVGLFGPTNPEIYLQHYPLSTFLWNTNVKGKDCEKTFPCFGINARVHWCRQRHKSLPWCLEQISPETVVAKVEEHWNKYKKVKFYQEKADSLFDEENRLFVNTDYRVELHNLNKVVSEKPLDKLIQKVEPTEREFTL